MSEQAKLARDAAVQSLAANAVYLALVGGMLVWMTRRDWLARQWERARRVARRQERDSWMNREVASFRQAFSRWEHEQ